MKETPVEINLERLLLSRDARARRQRAWMDRYPERILICLTVILPGPVKRDGRSLFVAGRGVSALRDRFHPLDEECLDLETGFEGYFVVEGDLLEVKEACCDIEDSDPVGRLMDIDVLERVGESVVPVSREQLGRESRRCLLCGRPARECMRAHSHTPVEISRKIDEMVDFALKL